LTAAIDIHIVGDWVGERREIRLGSLEVLLWTRHAVIVAGVVVTEEGAYVGDKTRE